MKKSLLSLAVFGAFAAASTSALAQERPFGVSVSVGTTGAGLHLITPVASNLNARIGFNAFSKSDTETTDDATYRAKAKLQTFDALLDYHPGGSSFRVTGGLVFNGNEVTATARPTAAGTYTFDGTTYSADDVGQVKGKIDWNKVAPYIGIGWGNAVAENKGWGFTADLGVMFQGKPDAYLRSTGCTGSATLCSELAADLEAESRELRDELDKFKYYPVARVGVTYKF